MTPRTPDQLRGSSVEPEDKGNMTGIQQSAREDRRSADVGRRAQIGFRPDWLLSITLGLIAVCAWPPQALTPATSLDGGWVTGLQLAQADGLSWGHDVIYTY